MPQPRPKPSAKILDIALSVREDAEKLSMSIWWIPSDLTGLCHYTSYELVQRLRKAGYRSAVLVSGDYNNECAGRDGHAWVIVAGFAVDVTATQFGQEKRVYFERATGPGRKLQVVYRGIAASRSITKSWHAGSKWKTGFNHKGWRRPHNVNSA
jgi:hypothetical protein